jgi:hypothetical protein
MKTTFWRVAVLDSFRIVWRSLAIVGPLIVAHAPALADGCFVFRWDKQKDINEPTQKAIILHDQGREDLILQVKYQGPAEDFGWLIPVPGKPEVRKGSMEPFYELSRLTQEAFLDPLYRSHEGLATAPAKDGGVKVTEIKTVGAYQVAVLSTSNPAALTDWLAAHQFHFPREKQRILDQYILKHWYFVAARIDPTGNGFAIKSSAPGPGRISPVTREKLASGELHPIVISFISENCIFPLAISSANGTPSELSLYVVSKEPLLSPLIYDRTLKACATDKDEWLRKEAARREDRPHRWSDIPREPPMRADPNDPPPTSAFDHGTYGADEFSWVLEHEFDFYSTRPEIVHSLAVNGDTNSLKGCRHDLPRLGGNQWWVTKIGETFRPEEMVDLEFDAALPFLSERLRTTEGGAAARALPQYGSIAVPVILGAFQSSDSVIRARALDAAAEFADPRFVEPILKAAQDGDPGLRIKACQATHQNWNETFVVPLLRLCRDPDPGVAHAAYLCLRARAGDLGLDSATLPKLLNEDTLACTIALEFMRLHRQPVSREQLLHLLSYTNLPTVGMAYAEIRQSFTLSELSPLITNPLPMARLLALGALRRIGDKPAVDLIISMLHDPNEANRWRVRSCLRQLTGQKLGADPAAYEKWWAENRATYTPKPPAVTSRRSPRGT